jgi:hypothetical protein
LVESIGSKRLQLCEAFNEAADTELERALSLWRAKEKVHGNESAHERAMRQFDQQAQICHAILELINGACPEE